MSWIAPWRNNTIPQWVAPLPKSAPPRPIPIPPDNPPPTPPPPPPPGLMPQFRSEKRRKLQDFTNDMLQEPWKFNSSLIAMQEECFQEYEMCIQALNSKVMARDSCIHEQKKNINNLNKQIQIKINNLRKRSTEVLNLRSTCLQLQTQIDNLSIQMMTDASEQEEKVLHYKNLVKGLQKNTEEAEKSAQYINCVKQLLFNHGEGESLENSLKTSERYCSICMENKANILCSPCMHLEYCTGCALNYHNLNIDCFGGSKKCSVNSTCSRCKGDVKELIYVFT